MSDLIERQAAIDALEWRWAGKAAFDAIKNLPSAQPEPERFKSCKNCIHLGHGYMMPCKNCRRNQMMPDWYEAET